MTTFEFLVERDRAGELDPDDAADRDGICWVSMFVTCENRANPHTTVHRAGCNQIAKPGGVRRHGQGGYHNHASFKEADAYAKSTQLPVVYCSSCHPDAATKEPK